MSRKKIIPALNWQIIIKPKNQLLTKEHYLIKNKVLNSHYEKPNEIKIELINLILNWQMKF